MAKRKHSDVLKAILSALSDGKSHSFGYLERKANTNWKSIRNLCKELEIFRAVQLENLKVTITKDGREILSRL